MSTYQDDQSATGSQYGQYGQPQYPAPSYGQQPVQAYGTPPAYGEYGTTAKPKRPGGVVTAAVFGFIWGALGAVVTIALITGGAFLGGASGSADSALPGLGAIAGAAAGVFIVMGVLALIWTVVMIWGSVWAVTGRSRVMLIVGGAIAIATTGFAFFGSLSGDSNAGGIIAALVLFVVSILIVVLLAVRSAGQFYAGCRAARGR